VRKDCASVILWCAEKATWMAGEGIQIFGGNGYINDYPLGRCGATPSCTRLAPAPVKSAAC
jgi:alkylation response protein AidB-like acyl-CoA dehydrogenase